MKKLFIIVSALIIVGALGYGVFYLISSDPKISSDSIVPSVELSDSNGISEWREENRTGISSEKGLLKSWPVEGPRLIWSNIELPKGHSSVTFGNNTIYLTGNDDQNDILVALDASEKSNGKHPTAVSGKSQILKAVVLRPLRGQSLCFKRIWRYCLYRWNYRCNCLVP